MRAKLSEKLEIPSGVSAEIKDKRIVIKKGSVELSRSVDIPNIEIKIEGNDIILNCKSGNKKNYTVLKSMVAHLKNMLNGLNEKFTYKLEACNVHFPMTLKIDKNAFLINNFLGEKQPRIAQINPNVIVEIKGQKITVSSHDREAAGQTAANIEKATKIRNRDRRIFQDGIYIVEKPGVSHG